MKALILITLFFGLWAPAWSAPQKRKLSDSDLGAVIQAVEDEIYDYGYQKHFYHIGENIGTSSAPRTRIRIYIDPEIDATNQSGQIIYKLMPYGEVFRDYFLENGLVVLAGDPQNGFPQTQESSTKTLYMDDDEVCRMKRDWLRRFFTVDDSPSPSRIQQAVQRQKLRTGFSDWDYHHSGNAVTWAIPSASSTGQNNSKNMGLSVTQFRTFVESLPPLPGTIQAIQFCRTHGFWIDRAALLTQGEASGWQIFVFRLQESDKFTLEWKSGRLPDSFAVSSADQFQTYDLSGEQALKFSGCASHNCPDVFSVMLYVPSKKAAFTATYVRGKVTYSPRDDRPEYRRYKMSLDDFIAEHRNITN